MRMKTPAGSWLIASIVLLAPVLAFAQAPTNLTVKSATNKQTALSWSGSGSFNVQRAVLGGAFSTIASANTASYTDTTIDAYTTYRYQIVAASGSTTPTNPVTVGPPPAGFSVAAGTPGTGQVDGNYGYDLSIVLDGNGDPAMSWMFYDPNADSDPTDTQVLFRSWNRAQNAWNPIVKIATTNGDTTSYYKLTLSLAFDSSTGTFGVAFEDDSVGDYRVVSLFLSTDGATWTKKTSFSRSSDSVGGPSLALANGNIYAGFTSDNEGIFFITGKLSAAASSWSTVQPVLPSTVDTEGSGTGLSVALDSAGNPGVAFWTEDDVVSYNQILFFWRPLEKTVVKVTDTQGHQSDSVEEKLIYYGLNPRIQFFAQRSDGDFGVVAHFVRSEDRGATWKTPVLIPPDGNSSTDYPADIAIDSKGDIAFAMGRNSGSGDSVCGNPKVSLSTDGVNFKTCSVDDGTVSQQFASFPSSLQVAYGGNDRLYLLWWESGRGPVGTGILMYRQPPLTTTATPVINTDGTGVNNGGTNLPGGIVAGSWVAVKGANFSDSPLDWSNADFSNGLPTTLNGVQVLMNGAKAAVYYVSPGQINVQAPNSVASGGTISVQVVRNGAASNTVTLEGSTTAPGIFAYTLDLKTFYPAAVFLDGTIIGDPAVAGNTVRKAKAGDRIQLYVTGLNVSPAGVIINGAISVSPTPQVVIGTTPATVEFAGLVAPGEYQMNVVIPTGLVPAGQTSANPSIVVKMNGQSSQSGVVIPISN
jgi:uncharacterized protein (TIGR03437 family)